jgi:N6-adenosine-specific RNA methylase IME4
LKGSALVKLDVARKALAEVRGFDDLLAVRDKAEEARYLLNRQRYSLQAQNDAAEIKLRAERRLGVILDTSVRHEGGRPKKNGDTMSLLLPDDVSKKESSRWQMVSKVEEGLFERFLAETRDSEKEITQASLLKIAKKGKGRQKWQADGSPCCKVKDLARLVSLGKKFGAIYADPPWQYGNQTTRAATDNHYPTMTIEEIAALPVGDLAAKQSHLHLWATDSFLEEAITLLKGWGFERRQTFVWVKPQLGIGNYWRSSHEYMLLGVRGGLTFPQSEVKSWIQHDRTEHSAKPQAVRKLIEQMSPPPRLELFARQPVDGWVLWGNQIERGMFDQDIKEL